MRLATAMAALASGDAAPLAAVLLHRVEMEDGLATAVGRPAVIAALMAEAVAAPVQSLGSVALACLRLDGAAERHIWARMEAGRVARLTLVHGRADVDDAEADAIGLAHPTHRPLGELASGTGQFAAPRDDPAAPLGDRLLSLLNARSLDARLFAADARWNGPDGEEGTPDARRDWWRRLFATVPDAWITPVASLSDGDWLALGWQLQGHLAGRRVSLPGSTLLRLEDNRIATERTAVDLRALAATAHRPFYPD